MDFTVSSKEISRRKKAFISLLISILLATILYSLLFSIRISTAGYIILFILSIFLIFITLQFLNSLSTTTLHICNNQIELSNREKIRKFLLQDIKSIRIKNRSNKAIREICLNFSNSTSLYISGFENDFAKISKVLLDDIDKHIPIKQIREPINFDSPLFYPMLGQVIGFMSIILLKTVAYANLSTICVIIRFSSIYFFLLALYFYIKKPIFSRSAGESIYGDYIFTLLLLAGGIFMLIIGGICI